MRLSGKTDKIRVVMLLYSLPPMPMGGAELQGIKLSKYLNERGVKTEIITWGKLWHAKRGTYDEVQFTRIRSILNLITDIPSLLKKKSTVPGSVKILYDSKTENTTEVKNKVGLAMILRYQLFYINCLIYLWLRRKEFDIIHVNMMEWPGFVAAKIGKKLKKKVVIKDSTMNGISNLLRYPGGLKKKRLIAENAHCIAMTNAIRENFILAGIPEDHITNISNGIEIISKPEARSHNRAGRVIFVGNLTQQPAKGVDVLLLAWQKVIEKRPGAKLSIVGQGDLASYQAFTESRSISSSVHFLGKRKDIAKLLDESDLFVLPSRREGMSNALMEAMLHAMPIVATDISGNQDLIENHVSGKLVPPDDTDALADAILFMIENPEAALKMGEAAYESIVQKCDIRMVAKKYHDVYNKILNPA